MRWRLGETFSATSAVVVAPALAACAFMATIDRRFGTGCRFRRCGLLRRLTLDALRTLGPVVAFRPVGALGPIRRIPALLARLVSAAITIALRTVAVELAPLLATVPALVAIAIIEARTTLLALLMRLLLTLRRRLPFEDARLRLLPAHLLVALSAELVAAAVVVAFTFAGAFTGLQ